MTISTQTPRVDSDKLNQEVTQQQILDKLCDLLGQSNDGWHESGSATATTGADVSIWTSAAVPAGQNRYLNKIEVTCNRAGKFRILVGATQIGSGNLTASVQSYPFLWLPAYNMTATQTVEVRYEQFRGTDALVEVYAHGIEE